ncbi:hypothetical protein [Chryseobacterium culicis]|uniref:hypothetical protein n=1 Tax=Chryseobacterium culicis TaxID=680127 RepID=UPI0018761A58|nr:hypothetical protein [Chryseobacterium culicis]MBE4948179.1 hypothetical protein [Chryseobacterium culicis]
MLILLLTLTICMDYVVAKKDEHKSYRGKYQNILLISAFLPDNKITEADKIISPKTNNFKNENFTL